MDDPLRFKRQLYSSWTQVEAILKPKTSDEIFSLAFNLLRIDPLARTLNYTPQHRNSSSSSGGGSTSSGSSSSSIAIPVKRDSSSAPKLSDCHVGLNHITVEVPRRQSSGRSSSGTPPCGTPTGSSGSSGSNNLLSTSAPASPSQPKTRSTGRPPGEEQC